MITVNIAMNTLLGVLDQYYDVYDNNYIYANCIKINLMEKRIASILNK